MEKKNGQKHFPVYLFSGADEYLLAQDAGKLVSKLVPSGEQALGLESIEAQARKAEEAAASLARCIEAARTAGFMNARKVIWLKQANFFDRGSIARSGEVSELVLALAKIISAGLPQENILVITANAVDRASAFFKACSARGQVNQQPELKPFQKEKAAQNFLRTLLQKDSLTAAPEVLAEIVDLAGTDSRQLVQEINKLAAFIHPRKKIESADVRAIVCAGRESNAFNLADAAGLRDLPGAIAILRQLLFQGENAIGLTMALETRFRYLFILDAMRGEKDEAVAALLASDKGRPMHPYFMGRLKEQARKFSSRELEKNREAILETRLKLVSSASEVEDLLLEKLLVELCRQNSRQ